MEAIHTDVCGSMNTPARGGYSYFRTFTDHYNLFEDVYLIKDKHESFERFKEFHSEVENQLGKNIKTLRFDRKDKYLSHEFETHLRDCEIVSQLTPAGTP